MGRIDQFLANAATAQASADSARDFEVKRQYNEIARQWRELAVRAGHSEPAAKADQPPE